MTHKQVVRGFLSILVVGFLVVFFMTEKIQFQNFNYKSASFNPFNSTILPKKTIPETPLEKATSKLLAVIDQISNMENSVLPNQTTAILTPFQNLTCHDSGKGLFLILIVISVPENIQRREVIRSTFNEMRGRWEEQFREIKGRSNGSELEVSRALQVFFFVGQSAKNGISDKVREEWTTHGDLIVDDFQEAYLNLTVKTLRMLKWALQNCGAAKYLMKLDDDVFLNLPKLFSFLLRQPNGYNPILMGGHLRTKVTPQTHDHTSKWFFPASLWNRTEFPHMLGGLCYVMGLQAARGIFEESRKVPVLHIEDVFITGIVASDRLHYELTDFGQIIGMLSWCKEYSDELPNSKMAIHEVSPELFRCWTRNTGHSKETGIWNGSKWPLLNCLDEKGRVGNKAGEVHC